MSHRRIHHHHRATSQQHRPELARAAPAAFRCLVSSPPTDRGPIASIAPSHWIAREVLDRPRVAACHGLPWPAGAHGLPPGAAPGLAALERRHGTRHRCTDGRMVLYGMMCQPGGQRGRGQAAREAQREKRKSHRMWFDHRLIVPPCLPTPSVPPRTVLYV